MTREEAINIILQMIKDEEGFLSDNTVEAHKMALKALEQEPISCQSCKHLNEDTEICLECEYDGTTRGMTKYEEQERCEDAISRKAVFNQIFYSTDNNGDVILGSVLRERIARLPSVTPQDPNTGHWIIVEELHGEWEGTKKYACDKCGEKVGVFKSKYCPNCGAKMEVKE